MKSTIRSTLIAAAIAGAFVGLPAAAQQSSKTPSPADATARPVAPPGGNLPSDSGAQKQLPSGAVTGAGQSQVAAPQQDVGSPGGVEARAKAEARSDPDKGDGARGSARGSTSDAGAQGSARSGQRER